MPQEILVDARWLEAPEPMEKALSALASLRPGQRLRFLLHREPFPLYGILDDMGFVHRTTPLADGSFEILIQPRPESLGTPP